MESAVLPLLKARLGISTDSRDALLNALIIGIVSDCLNTHGIALEEAKAEHVMFVHGSTSIRRTEPHPEVYSFDLKI